MTKRVAIGPPVKPVAPDVSLESESGSVEGLIRSLGGVKTSSCCSLKCSETAAGRELVSLSASVHQLPALASGASH